MVLDMCGVSGRCLLLRIRSQFCKDSGFINSLRTYYGRTNCSVSKLNRILHPGARATVKPQDLKTLRCELNAALRIFEKSGFNISKHTSSCRSFHTSAHHGQNKQPNDDKEKKDDDNENMSSLLAKAFLWMLTGYMIIATMSLLFPSSNQPEVIRYVSWNEFLHHMLAKGEVEEIIVRPDLDVVTVILYDGAVIKGKRVDHSTYHMNIVDIKKFEEKLRAAEQQLGIPSGSGVTVVYERGSDTAGKLLASVIVASIIISLLSRARSAKNPISMDRFSQMGRAKFTLIDPVNGQGRGVKFSDVAGLKEVKQEVMEVVDYLKRPEYYKGLGAKVPKGVLLLGPPGCGKTLLAKAVATEAQVPFLSMNGSEFIEMIGGLGAARVRDLFKEGKKRTPCIIYIDEIDALGRKRSGGFSNVDTSTGEGEQTLNQLLVEMDGMATKEGVLMLASTNRADVLDKALLRPGRFDRHILIDLPNMQERTEIFEYHLKNITLDKPPNTYSRRLAFLTPGFSGADIANVCNEAALHAARILKHKVTQEDLEYAIERVVGGTEKKSHAMSQEEKTVVAYHETGHALVGWLLPHTDVLLKVTIVPRTNLALGFAQYTPSDQKLYSEQELMAKMCMALGGRVAEAVMFNKISTGAQNDLKKVTDMAYAMTRVYGMNKKVGLVSFEESKDGGRRPYSKRLASLIDFEVGRLVNRAFDEAYAIVEKNKDKLVKVAEELLKKETLNYDEVEKLIGPPLHGKKRMIDPLEFETSLRNAVPHQEANTPPPKENNTNS